MYCLRLRSEEEGGISSVTPSPNHNFEERDPERREEDREADPERREEDRAEEDPERREDFEEADFDAFENVNEVTTAPAGVVSSLSATLHAVVANQTRLRTLPPLAGG